MIIFSCDVDTFDDSIECATKCDAFVSLSLLVKKMVLFVTTCQSSTYYL